jgi:hypothetical protein
MLARKAEREIGLLPALGAAGVVCAATGFAE